MFRFFKDLETLASIYFSGGVWKKCNDLERNPLYPKGHGFLCLLGSESPSLSVRLQAECGGIQGPWGTGGIWDGRPRTRGWQKM